MPIILIADAVTCLDLIADEASATTRIARVVWRTPAFEDSSYGNDPTCREPRSVPATLGPANSKPTASGSRAAPSADRPSCREGNCQIEAARESPRAAVTWAD